MTQSIASKVNIMENSGDQGKETSLRKHHYLYLEFGHPSSRVRVFVNNKKVHCYQAAREAQISNDFTLSFFLIS